jgi:hypothetical protein
MKRVLSLYLFLVVLLLVLVPACLVHSTPAPVPAPIPMPAPAPAQPPLPSVLPLHTEGARFVDSEGKRWNWKGATDFLLLKKYLDGEDIGPILAQRKDAGANLVRVFGMCANIARFYPQEYPGFWEGLVGFVDYLADAGFYVELTVFADAQLVLPDLTTQIAHWQGFYRVANKPNVFLELVNENSHAGNTIRVERFTRLDGSALQSHGSEQTDMHYIEPAWDLAGIHVRRDPPPDARGATNYDCYEFEARFPKARPEVGDEGIKTTNEAYAALMGTHAAICGGGTFHSQAGVTSQLWNEAEFAAARAFYQGVGK